MPDDKQPTPTSPAEPKKRRRALSPENFAKQLERKTSLLIDDAIEQAKKGKPALLRILLQLAATTQPPADEEEQPPPIMDLLRNTAVGRRAAEFRTTKPKD
jgi:hypothetical protein